MSLLMDALKKAEKARQAQQTEGVEPARDPAETQGFVLDPLDTGARAAPAAPDADAPHAGAGAAPAPPGAPRPEDTGTGELEWSLADSQEIEALERDTPPPSTPDPPSAPPPPGGPSLSLVDEEAISDDTSATLPSMKAAQASVDSYFDGTHSMSMSMEQVRAAMDDEDTAERRRASASTGERTSPRAARTMFEAKAAPPRRRGGASRAVGVVLLLLIVVGVAGAGGWFYWQTIDQRPSLVPARDAVARRAPPPAAPARVEPQPAASAPARASAAGAGAGGGGGAAAAAPEGSDASSAAAGAEAPAVMVAQAERAEMAATPVPARGDLTAVEEPEPEPEPVAPMPELPPAPDPAEIAAARLGEPENVVRNLAEAIDSAGLQPAGLSSSGISISRRTRPRALDDQLTRAWQAWHAGDLGAAREAYGRILAEHPRSRDAMLGLAAVAMRAGNFSEAGALYSRVLRAHPRDSHAQAGLLALQDNLDPVRGESALKSMLAREPDAPHLHFSLGNLYAAQSRWPEAQEAYFEAWRGDSDNADYVYNLAVSLDHLAQRDTALELYRRALELADSRPAGFEPQSVLARIRAMTAQ